MTDEKTTRPIEELAPSRGDVDASSSERTEDAELPMMLRTLMQQAVENQATDIHLDVNNTDAAVRFRIDGVVHETRRLPREQAFRLINQVKVVSGLDIELAHEPLESQFQWTEADPTLNVRVTMAPTLHHEAVHMRLLTPRSVQRKLTDLGIEDDDLAGLRTAMHHRHGLILIAGQSGSGKTTTLYTMASSFDLEDRVAVSIEDPIEFDLAGVRQVEVDAEHGLTMARGLKTLLRMDPDILMVGEVRDRSSAITAGHAAVAGRLVMATLHARDVASAIDAMHFEAVPYYILGGSLRLVITQGLVRLLCPECRESRSPRKHEAELFERYGVEPPDEMSFSRRCSHCNQLGYRGRTGVFEIAAVDDEFGGWLFHGPHQQKVREHLRERGVKPMIHDALRKVAAGRTSLDEAIRFANPMDLPPELLREDHPDSD